MRLDDLLDLRELLHQLLIDMQTPAGIDDQHVLAFGDGAVTRPGRDLHWIAIGALFIDGSARLSADLDQLLDGSRSIHVAGRHRDGRSVLLSQVSRELCGRGRLAGSL